MGVLDGEFEDTDPKNLLEIGSVYSLKGGDSYATDNKKQKVKPALRPGSSTNATLRDAKD